MRRPALEAQRYGRQMTMRLSQVLLRHVLYRTTSSTPLRFLEVPTSTDNRIEGLCDEIRALCGEPFSSQTEAQLRKLARELRMAIRQHVDMAKSSLTVKKTAIAERDPDEK